MLILIEITLLLITITRCSSASDSYNEKCDTEICNSTLMKKISCNLDKCHGYLLPKGPCDCCPICVGFEEKSTTKIFPTSTESIAVVDKTIPKTKELPRAGEVNEKENEEYNLEYDYGTDEDDDEEESEETKQEIAKFLKVLLSEPKSAESPTEQLKKKIVKT